MDLKSKAKRGRPPKNKIASKLCDVRVQNLYKLDLSDTKIERDVNGKAKALKIEMEISASGKVTNGRIYPPKGHQAGLDSWTKPFGKVVLRNHNDDGEPIGRYVDAVWVDNEEAALGFLNGDYKALAAIKRSFDSGDAKLVYKTMKQYDALGKKWPGLGKVIGTVRILDEDAIEKFLDGRYLTWSAGQTTDALICMACNSDWRKGEFCDHQMGGLDDNGDPVVFLCGTMYGEEGSVVNKPANDTSITLSMKFEDSALDDRTMSLSLSDQLDTAPTVVPIVTVENTMNLTDLQALEINTVLGLLKDEANILEFVDALAGNDHFEINWLIRIHDALHDQWDYQLKYSEPGAPPRMPISVYKLHGAIHDLSMEKDFRDSMMNGVLDEYDSAGGKSDEYMVSIPGMDDKAPGLILTDEQMSVLTTQIAAALAASGVPNGVESDGTESNQEEVKEEDSEVLNAEVPESNDSPSAIGGEDSSSGVVPVVSTEGSGDSTSETSSSESGNDAPVDSETAQSGTDETDCVDDDSIDWATLDLALNSLVGEIQEDAKLSTEKRKSLSKSSFCGPDRSFPVPDCAHVTAARRLIGRAKLSSDQKSKVLACVSRKAKNLGCSEGDSSDSCHCEQDAEKLIELQRDYTVVLATVEQLKDELTTALKTLRVKLEPSCDNNSVKLDALQEWFATLNAVNLEDSNQGTGSNKSKPKQLKPTQDPVIQTGKEQDHKVSIKKDGQPLTRFETNVINKYNSILKTKDGGKAAADEYLLTMVDFLPANFEIQKHVVITG